MRYSNFAKIIDPQSEYYGQVFEVYGIYPNEKEVCILHEPNDIPLEYNFNEIQFCVTKDNEPVKIGEEYLCLQDLVQGDEIYDWIEFDGEIEVYVHTDCKYGRDDNSYELDEHFEFTSLHPTNKIKITAEGKEYSDFIKKALNVGLTDDQADFLWEEFNRLSK